MSSTNMRVLAQVSRWRRQQHDGYWPLWESSTLTCTWTNRRDGHRVALDSSNPYADWPVIDQIRIVRLGKHSWDNEDRTSWITVESAQQAIDVLAAYGVLPVEFTTGYRAAQAYRLTGGEPR